MPATFTDVVAQVVNGVLTARPGTWIQLRNNSTQILYTASGAADLNSVVPFANVPPGVYTVRSGLAQTGPFTDTTETGYIVPFTPTDSAADITPFATILLDMGGAVFNLAAYGKVDGQVDVNVATTIGFSTISTTTSSGPWKATDIGKSFVLSQGGGANANLYGTITGFTDSKHIAISAVAVGTLAGQQFAWFTDNTAAIQGIINTLAIVSANGARVGAIEIPAGWAGFTGQLTQPQGTSIKWRGQGKAASGLYYGGSVQRSAYIMPGANNGTTFEAMWAAGPLADPFIDLQTLAGGVGSGTAYNSLVSTIDCQIGYPLVNGAAFPGIFLSYSGMKVQCDVFQTLNTLFSGRNYGLRLQAGTTDAYLTNTNWSSLPQGGEPRGLALWCEDVAAGLLFSGTTHLVNCSGSLGSEATVLLRSIADVYGLYIESCANGGTGVGVKMTTGVMHMFAGKIATPNTSGTTHLIQCINSHGFIIGTYLGAPVGANALVDLINTSGSPFLQAWDIILPPKGSIAGTLPATLISCDSPHVLSFVGNSGPGTAQQYNGQSFDTDSASGLNLGLINANAVFIAKAGVLTTFGGSLQIQAGGGVDTSAAGAIFIGGTNANSVALGRLGFTTYSAGFLSSVAQMYPGAEGLALQNTGGLLHAVAVPTNGNGNNNDWIHSDNGHIYFRRGGVWQDMTAAITAQATPANPAGTASTTGVMMGLAGSITPARTGNILVIISGDILNATAIADGGSVQIRTGTGTAPVNGDATHPGTARGGKPQYIAATTAEKAPFSVQAVITGLTLGTAVWLDLEVAAITGGTASVENISISAVEV